MLKAQLTYARAGVMPRGTAAEGYCSGDGIFEGALFHPPTARWREGGRRWSKSVHALEYIGYPRVPKHPSPAGSLVAQPPHLRA